MELILSSVDGKFKLEPLNYFPVEYHHMQPDPEVIDNDKAILYGRYRDVAQYIVNTYKHRECTLFARKQDKIQSLLSPIQEAGSPHSRWKLQTSTQPFNFWVHGLSERVHVLIHHIKIYTYMQDKLFGWTVDFEWIKPDQLAVKNLLRGYRIENLLSV